MGNSWTALCAEEFEGGRKAAGADFYPWRLDAADATRLALHVLLLECVCHEPVSGESWLRGACGELPLRNWLWPRVSRSAEPCGARRERISGHCRGWKIFAIACGGGCKASRIVGRELRRIFDGAGSWAQLRYFCGGRGHARSARLADGQLGREKHFSRVDEAGARVVAGDSGGYVEVTSLIRSR